MPFGVLSRISPVYRPDSTWIILLGRQFVSHLQAGADSFSPIPLQSSRDFSHKLSSEAPNYSAPSRWFGDWRIRWSLGPANRLGSRSFIGQGNPKPCAMADTNSLITGERVRDARSVSRDSVTGDNFKYPRVSSDHPRGGTESESERSSEFRDIDSRSCMLTHEPLVRTVTGQTYVPYPLCTCFTAYLILSGKVFTLPLDCWSTSLNLQAQNCS